MHKQQTHQQTTQQSMQQAQYHDIVRAVYRGFLEREPDASGLQYWSGVLACGGDPCALVKAVMDSAEYVRHAGGRAARHEVAAAVAQRAGALFQDAPLTIVDIGAQDLRGEQHVYAPLGEHALPCRVIGFEPLEHRLGERQRREGERQGTDTLTLYPHFIGDGKRHVFHINDPDATSSLLPFNHALNRELVDLSELHTDITMEVETSELDEVLAATARVDFLKLDIQGFELTALQHARAVLERTSVVHCEVGFAPIYANQPLFSEVEILLREHGFYFLDFSSTCRYAYHGGSGSSSRDRLGWADAVFFKERALLGQPQDLLAQLLIALLVYGKYSLAEALAERYDAQSSQAQPGTGFAPLFRAAQPA
jgi:FkbM family methyltransferase